MNRSWVRFPQAAQRFAGKPANSQAKNSHTPYAPPTKQPTKPQVYAERARVRSLEEEKSLRAQMNRRDLAREEYQRANRHAPITGSGDPNGPRPQAAYTTRVLPEEWCTALTSQRSILRESLIQAGKDAKVQPWMQGVCQPEHLTDEQWNTTVGQIQLWRATHKISPDLSVREAASQVCDVEIRALMDSFPVPIKEKQLAAGQKEAGEEDPHATPATHHGRTTSQQKKTCSSGRTNTKPRAPTRQVVIREDAQCSPRNRSCLLSFSYSLLHHILNDCDGTYQRY